MELGLFGNLAVLSLVSPWWALGAIAAIGLPVVAHLLSRSRYREVCFPTTRWVQEAAQATARVERPRHLLLLLLRGLMLLLVVAAFTRPQWTPQTGTDGAADGASVIVLLDASASMRRTSDGATVYERAQREAAALLDGLDPSRDVASVVQVDRTPTSLLPEPTARLDRLRGRLASSNASFETANWAAAVALAQRLAEQTDRKPKLVVISDEQGVGPMNALQQSSLRETPVDFIRIDSPSNNIAARLVDIRPYPPVVGQPFITELELLNTGTEERSVSLVSRRSDTADRQQLNLQANSIRRVAVTLTESSPGPGLIRFFLENNDALPADNTTGTVLSPIEQASVLVVYRDAEAGPRLAKRVATMLSPGNLPGQALPQTHLASVDDALARIRASGPDRLRTVVLLEPLPSDAPLTLALQAYAEQGGGVITFASAVPPDAASITATNIDFSLEPLRIFEGPARAGLTSLRWSAATPALGLTTDMPAQNVLSAGEEQSIVTAYALGRGRWVHLHCVLSHDPGGLLAEPAFVVLFNELARFASPGMVFPPPAHPGDTIPATLLEAEAMDVPDGADPLATVFTAPGLYRATHLGELIEQAWVEIDPAESSTATSAGWSRSSPALTPDSSKTTPSRASALSLDRSRIELWPYLIAIAVLLAASESALLWRYTKNEGADT